MSTKPKQGRGRPRKHPIAASATPSVDPSLTQEQLLSRKTEIQNRLLELEPKPIIVAPNTSSILSGGGGGGDASNASAKALLEKLPTSIPKIPIPSTFTSTTDDDKSTHWDFTLKEMLWLSADFQSERKRQISHAKKLSNAIKQYHATLHTRKIRERAEFEARVRRLAAKLNRNVQRGYWKKIERVVGYKQRLDGEERRRKDMDKHLVFLVRQTEKYGESLTRRSSALDGNGDGNGEGGSGSQQLTIEEALSQSDSLGRRKSKLTSVDYTKMDRDENYNERTFYGERVMTNTNPRLASSPTSNSNNNNNNNAEDNADEEYQPSDTELMEEADTEKKEYEEFLTSFREQCPEDVREEVNKLLEEQEMDLDTLLQRLVEEGQQQMEEATEEQDDQSHPVEPMEIEEKNTAAPTRRRHVSFAASHQERTFDPSPPSVESMLGEDDHEEKDEFHLDREDVDDETTIEAEERLGRDMSYSEEIELLNRENEMSVEELRAMYANMEDEHDESAVSNNDDIETENDLSMLAEDDHEEKDEFHIENEEKDDETTIEAEEKLGRDMSYQDEIDMLQRESEMSIEELRAMYANMEESGVGTDTQQTEEDEVTEETAMSSLLAEDDHEEKDEFHLEHVEVDDETTLEAEEKLGRDMSYQDEIDLLQRESEISVEELRAMYANMEEGGGDCNGGGDDGKEVSTATSTLDLLNEDDHEEKDEFHMEEDEVDDETTIEAEERLGRDMSYEQELSQLQEENEMSTEELRRLYGLDADEDAVEDGDEEADGDGMETSTQKPEKRKLEAVDCPDDDKSAKKTKNASDEGMAALQSLAASDEKARQTMLTRPFLLASWVKLRAYQQVGMNWLVSAQSRRLNSILADEMGLGKTLQTISMLAYLASYKGIWGPHLIIVPTSCLVNWEVEFKRFCPGLKVLCYYGNAKRRKELRVGWTKSNMHHVIITSYQLAVQDSFAFKRKKWYYLILDEAHNIKNFESQRWQTLINFNTQRRLLLTGTPLQNNLMELWSLLHFLMPHVFRDRKEFSYWFSNPMDNIIEGNARRNDDLINRLHGIIRPFVLRRLKKDVETQLPGKFEHIIKCQLSRRQMFLYEEFMARSSTRKAMQHGGNFMGMMSVLMQLRKVCNHPDLFEPRSVTTPFVMEPLTISTAACVVDAIEEKSGLERLSPHFLAPLWTIGRGTSSFEKATSVDSIIGEQLNQLVTPTSLIIQRARNARLEEPSPRQGLDAGLFSLLSRIREGEKEEKVARATAIGEVNTRRCSSHSFPYSNRLCAAVTLEQHSLNLPLKEELSACQIARTPIELLAMRKSQQQRGEDLDELVDKFVFSVPKAGSSKPILVSSKSNSSSMTTERELLSKTSDSFSKYFSPYQKAQARLTMCFPDKKLVQFDAGKLQKMATLLRDLKQGGHRVLIFTQMSKMLDVLEAFLNLNGHTYLRLDGGTDVDRRQRLMDRFNSDLKVFCFILSTRSGGLGINLTGADTVIFYDSDWNPAMDAQAQDRAHRIGQTKEVHIYRMVTEHTIEENILTKAKQKRNLDLLVMDEGKFHAESVGAEPKTDDGDGFTKGGLQSILGVNSEAEQMSVEPEQISNDQMESVMNALEDEDDVKAMQSAKKEATDALEEFDESINYKQDGDEAESSETKNQKVGQKTAKSKKQKTGDKEVEKEDDDEDDKDMEKEFAKWQSKVGIDSSTINESLNPLERYGLNVKEFIDPYYSPYFWAEQQRLAQATSSVDSEWDLDSIEQKKVEEEQRAFEDGDLLATFPEPESLPRQRQLYIREKARVRAELIKRKLTGENWITKIEQLSGKPFWYNSDTGEAIWEKPSVLKMLEAESVAMAEGWTALPSKPLVNIMEFLLPHPERTQCSMVCRRWREAANDISFVFHVWPVEQGALVMDESKLGKNHFRSIADALEAALPGDTIELGDGHYFINDPGLIVNCPVRIVGDENEPAHVILEMSGELVWKARGGWMEGVTIRRPRIAAGEIPVHQIMRIDGGRLNMYNCVFDNTTSLGHCISANGYNAGGTWEKAIIKGGSQDKSGLVVENGACIQMVDGRICENSGAAITCRDKSVVTLSSCIMERNGLNAIVKDENEYIGQSNGIQTESAAALILSKDAHCSTIHPIF